MKSRCGNMKRFRSRWITGLLLVINAFAISTVQAQLYENDSKRLGGGRMDIVFTEIERRPRASVVEIKINVVGSSVGSSFFILCSIRQLAQLRGAYRYIVKLEEQPKRNQMLIGFLRDAAEPPSAAAPEFNGLSDPRAVIDLEQFAPICDAMRNAH
jgi:hypothetical protein